MSKKKKPFFSEDTIIAIATVAVILIISIVSISSDSEIPPAPTTDIYVTDYAGMIDYSTKEKILAIGGELDAKYKAQIAVVTVDSLGFSTIEEYANELFRSWGIGDKNLNNGVLLLIAKDDRKFRIEVGYGLEGAITDGYAGEVLDGMKDYFREENYSEGILNAYKILTAKVYEEYGGEVPQNVAVAMPNTNSNVANHTVTNNTAASETADEELGLLDMFLGFLVIVFSLVFMYFFVKYIVIFPIAVVIFFFAVILHLATKGQYGTKSFRDIYYPMTEFMSETVFHIGSGGGGSSSGGGSSGSSGGGFGGGRSGGGGSSGGW